MASLVDAANPAVFVRAVDLGFTGKESPRDAADNPGILAIMEEIRVKAALMMKLAEEPGQVGPAVPKVAMVARAQDYETIGGATVRAGDFDLLARTKAMAAMHKAYAVTGGICVSAAALIPGTVVNQVVAPGAVEAGNVRVGHPSGISSFLVSVVKISTGEFQLCRSAVAGSARRIMDGTVHIPRNSLLSN
jgi:hypothetical protein